MPSRNAPPLVFFDASCLIAAAASPSGGSGLLLQIAQKGLITAVISTAVLAEAERNLLAKFRPEALSHHREQMAALSPIIAPIPRLDVEPRLYPEINPKDEHVIAAALVLGCDYLLTLDRPLLEQIESAQVPIVPLLPGDFIKQVLGPDAKRQ